MPTIFKVNILQIVAGILIGGAAIVVFALPYLSNLSNQIPAGNLITENNYDTDVQLLFQIAQQLGYAKENQLNFFRFRGSFESNDDVTTLVFSTTNSLDTFSERVDQLGLEHDTALGAVYGKQFVEDTFLMFINPSYSNSLVLADSKTEYSATPFSRTIAPLVTRWHLILTRPPSKQKRLIVRFAELPNETVFWKDKVQERIIAGPIVVLDLDRER